MVCNMSLLLDEKLNNEYEVSAIIKSRAVYKDITLDIVNLTKHFSGKDYVIIQGGLIDALKGQNLQTDLLNQLRDISLKTNLIIMTVPYWNGRVVLNQFIQEINKSLYNTFINDIDKCNVTLLDINNIVKATDFKYNNSMQLKYTGKLKLINNLKGLICGRKLLAPLPQSYIVYGNLTYIVPLVDCVGVMNTAGQIGNEILPDNKEDLQDDSPKPSSEGSAKKYSTFQNSVLTPANLAHSDTGVLPVKKSPTKGKDFLVNMTTIDLTN